MSVLTTPTFFLIKFCQSNINSYIYKNINQTQKQMKVTKVITQVVEVKYLTIHVTPRYWEDTTVNGVEDFDGKLIPCVSKGVWKPVIDIETGVVVNWNQGEIKNAKAEVHYKVCDEGTYYLMDAHSNVVMMHEGYVPSVFDFNGETYGDYIILSIDENGKIANWKFNEEAVYKNFKTV